MNLNLPDYLNDDTQSVIYRQNNNLMIVGSLQEMSYSYVQKVGVF